MTRSQRPVPTRRAMMAGALGIGALGGTALAAPAADAALGDPTIPSAAAGKYYLTLATIPGSVTDPGFEKRIELLTWGWGATSPANPLAASGGGTGKTAPKDVIFAARTDIHSPNVVLALNTSKTLASAHIASVKTGTKPYIYLATLFERVVITDYYVTPDPDDGVPMDVVHLKISKVTVKYTPQNQDGSASQPITTSFDYSSGTAGA
jgi:type VI secretion system secreted protein Hcp